MHVIAYDFITRGLKRGSDLVDRDLIQLNIPVIDYDSITGSLKKASNLTDQDSVQLSIPVITPAPLTSVPPQAVAPSQLSYNFFFFFGVGDSNLILGVQGGIFNYSHIEMTSHFEYQAWPTYRSMKFLFYVSLQFQTLWT